MSPASTKGVTNLKKKAKLLYHLRSQEMQLIMYVPIVPPNSMTQTSASPGFPSTGIFAALSIHS